MQRLKDFSLKSVKEMMESPALRTFFHRKKERKKEDKSKKTEGNKLWQRHFHRLSIKTDSGQIFIVT